MTRRLKGLSPDNSFLNRAWEYVRQRCANDPDLSIIEDLESGFPQVVSKEEHEKYLQMWEDLKPKGPFKDMGKLMIFGTAGNIDNNKDFMDNWNKL